MAEIDRSQIFEILKSVKDPEVPAIDIVELGIVRDAIWQNGKLLVDITPTYSGCPAMHMIEQEIFLALKQRGICDVEVRTVFSPAWTTDWMSEEARQKLKDYGIAPPSKVVESPLLEFPKRPQQIACPFCSSMKTKKTSEFGATACKALYYCDACSQPFEHFKAF